MTITVDAFDHIVINVGDVETSAAWYERVLGMTREEWVPSPGRSKRTAMRFGRQKINLRPAAATQKEWITGKSILAGTDDLCFLTTASPQAVGDHFRACGVVIEAGPLEKRGAMGTILSVYCRDPDGNLIEVSSYK
jgi:catechol 2,3-dioxygenase-like lactoylglutathione lyase family enzyme